MCIVRQSFFYCRDWRVRSLNKHSIKLLDLFYYPVWQVNNELLVSQNPTGVCMGGIKKLGVSAITNRKLVWGVEDNQVCTCWEVQHVERCNVNWCVFMDKIYKVVGTGEKFGKLVCVSCKKNLLVSFLYLLDNICAIAAVRTPVQFNAQGRQFWTKKPKSSCQGSI